MNQDCAIEAKDLRLYYGKNEALKGINMVIPSKQCTALIGPSGCGKSTFLRCINRMNDLIDDCHIQGELLIEGKNIYQKGVDVNLLRKRVGMVFQKPNPFPMSIYDNIAYAPPELSGSEKRTNSTKSWSPPCKRRLSTKR